MWQIILSSPVNINQYILISELRFISNTHIHVSY